MKHFIIPDTQAKPSLGNNYQHMTAAGNYVVDKQPEVIIHLGDNWDMPSLSSYDRSTKAAEGARFNEDITAGRKCIDAFMKPIFDYNLKQKRNKKKEYKPRLVFLLGNHEERIMRHVNANPFLDGTLGYHNLGLEARGWEVIDFLQPIVLDGVTYAHYFYNPMSGRAWGGKASTKLNNIGFSFVMGHQQGLDMAMKHLANGHTLRGIVAGSFYQHEEGYKGPQANDHWQGCLMLHEVEDGDFCLMELSLEYLLKEWL